MRRTPPPLPAAADTLGRVHMIRAVVAALWDSVADHERGRPATHFERRLGRLYRHVTERGIECFDERAVQDADGSYPAMFSAWYDYLYVEDRSER